MSENTNNIVRYSVTNAKIEELKNLFNNPEPKMETQIQRDEVKNALDTIRPYRTELEKERKIQKADALNFGRLVDSQAKEIKAKLEKIELPYLTAREEYRNREKIRVEKIQEKLFNIKRLGSDFENATLEDLELRFSKMESTDLEDMEEYTEDSILATQSALENICNEINSRKEKIKFEEDRKKLEEEKAEFEKYKLEKQKEENEKLRLENEKIKQEQDEKIRIEQAELENMKGICKTLYEAIKAKTAKTETTVEVEGQKCKVVLLVTPILKRIK